MCKKTFTLKQLHNSKNCKNDGDNTTRKKSVSADLTESVEQLSWLWRWPELWNHNLGIIFKRIWRIQSGAEKEAEKWRLKIWKKRCHSLMTNPKKFVSCTRKMTSRQELSLMGQKDRPAIRQMYSSSSKLLRYWSQICGYHPNHKH